MARFTVQLSNFELLPGDFIYFAPNDDWGAGIMGIPSMLGNDGRMEFTVPDDKVRGTLLYVRPKSGPQDSSWVRNDSPIFTAGDGKVYAWDVGGDRISYAAAGGTVDIDKKNGTFDGIVKWVQDNPIPAAVGGFFLFQMLGRRRLF